MGESGYGLDGAGKTGGSAGGPRTDELGAVVGLDAGLIEIDATGAEMIEDDFGEEGGVG
jgi:hypothetical protein